MSRDLDRDELRAMVERLAADPERWRHLVSHDSDQRVYEETLHARGPRPGRWG